MRHRDLILRTLDSEQVFAMRHLGEVAEVTPRHRLVYVDRQKINLRPDFDESPLCWSGWQTRTDSRTCGHRVYGAVQGSANSGAI